MISRHWIVAIALLMLTGCAVGPNYKRPPVTVPGTYRGLAADTDPQATASLGDEKWWTVYQDEQLQALIREAEKMLGMLKGADLRDADGLDGVQPGCRWPAGPSGGPRHRPHADLPAHAERPVPHHR